MLDHYIQRNIVYRLAFAPNGLRFSELKPDEIESKLFTYHLKKTVIAGFVVKREDGHYVLTPEGRRLGTKVFDKQLSVADRAESVLFLVIRRQKDNAWLLYRRTVHPLIDRVGFMHTAPRYDVDSVIAAQEACKAMTNLNCDFEALGSGYFRVFDGEKLESFTHFTLLVCNDAQGELLSNDEKAEYLWETSPDFEAASMLPNMSTLAALYKIGKPFFIEKTFRI